MGKAAATVDPDTLDQQEVDWFCREPFSRLIKDLVATRMPSEVVTRFCRGAMPSIGDAQAEMIRDACLHPEAYTAEEDDEDDFDDDEEEMDEARAARVCSTPAPSPNGEKAADPRPRATRPSANRGPAPGKREWSPAVLGRDGQP